MSYSYWEGHGEAFGMRVTTKGRVTIPQPIRKQAGLLPGTLVRFEIVGTDVRIRKARTRRGTGRGGRVAECLEAVGPIKMTTEEIMALLRDDEG